MHNNLPSFIAFGRLLFPLFAIVCWFSGPAAFANDPGGGTSGSGANVTISGTSNSSSTVTLSNGVISATIQKSTGKVTSYTFNGTQMLDTSGQIYYSMDGGATFDVPSGCVYSLVNSSTNSIEISCKRTWNSSAGYRHNLDIDLHYILRRGDTGVYTYAVLEHPATYPSTSFGEFRLVWKLPHDSTNFYFERAYVDSARNWKQESYYDFTHSTAMGIPEILKLSGTSWTGVLGSGYDCKYSYAAEYQSIGTWGHASNTNKKGVWIVPGGWDYFNDGPTIQDLTIAESYLLIHFGRDHFGGSGTSLAAGEPWKKLYGPFLLYCNTTGTTANAGDALWADAKAQSAAEQAAWPYSWMTNTDYPLAAGRGTVTGTLVVNDALKPSLTGSNAWVGVALPEDTSGNWQYQNKSYQTWVRADGSGNFVIPNIRPGIYTLYAFVDGAVGEFSKTPVTVTANATNAQGTVTWNVPHPGASIAWEIGVPNRSAKEFKHGNDYFVPYLWNTYLTELSNPLVYTVGSSNWSTDWNYAHGAMATTGTDGTTTYSGWNWQVNFNLPAVPASGNATLIVAVASSQYARLFLYINNDTSSFARISPANQGGNALLRQGIHAKYSVVYITIPVSKLNVGNNTFTFSQGVSDSSAHVMYDYLNLELPPFPPPPPSSGRSITWGIAPPSSTWDNGVTNSFVTSGSATSFGTGDQVTFDNTGSSTNVVTLSGTMEPNVVNVAGTKSYTFGGSGSLVGEMSLVKSGTGKLTITGSNSFAGPTIINGGTIAFGNDAANTYGLGTSDVTLKEPLI